MSGTDGWFSQLAQRFGLVRLRVVIKTAEWKMKFVNRHEDDVVIVARCERLVLVQKCGCRLRTTPTGVLLDNMHADMFTICILHARTILKSVRLGRILEAIRFEGEAHR